MTTIGGESACNPAVEWTQRYFQSCGRNYQPGSKRVDQQSSDGLSSQQPNPSAPDRMTDEPAPPPKRANTTHKPMGQCIIANPDGKELNVRDAPGGNKTGLVVSNGDIIDVLSAVKDSKGRWWARFGDGYVNAGYINCPSARKSGTTATRKSGTTAETGTGSSRQTSKPGSQRGSSAQCSLVNPEDGSPCISPSGQEKCDIGGGRPCRRVLFTNNCPYGINVYVEVNSATQTIVSLPAGSSGWAYCSELNDCTKFGGYWPRCSGS